MQQVNSGGNLLPGAIEPFDFLSFVVGYFFLFNGNWKPDWFIEAIRRLVKMLVFVFRYIYTYNIMCIYVCTKWYISENDGGFLADTCTYTYDPNALCVYFYALHWRYENQIAHHSIANKAIPNANKYVYLYWCRFIPCLCVAWMAKDISMFWSAIAIAIEMENIYQNKRYGW